MPTADSVGAPAAERGAPSRSYLWELRLYFRHVAGQLVLGSLCGIVMNTAVVLPPLLLGRAIDAALSHAAGSVSAGGLAGAIALYVGGVLAFEGPRVFKRWWLMTANARIRANLRADALRGVLAWPMARLHATPIGDVMARVVGDVEVLGVGVREFTIEMWDTVLFSVSLVVAMLVVAPDLALPALLPVPVAIMLAHATGRWVAARTTAARRASADLTAALQELLAGVRVLRLFGRTEHAVERVAALSRRQADANLATIRLRSGLQPVYTTLMTAGVVFVVWLGGERVVSGAMTLGTLVAFLELYLRFVNRGFRVPQLVNSVQSGGAAYRRIRPLLAPPRAVDGEPRFASFRPGRVAGLQDRPLPQPVAGCGPIAVGVEGLTVRYPGAPEPALRGVSLDAPPGALVAVTGPVGSGKSALARALVGLYPAEVGRVLLDGRPLESFAPEERAARVGYLPQEPYLFAGSVSENVLLSPPGAPAGERAALERAVRLAALGPDVERFPAGLETPIGEHGVRVSGGQRQRIALARALAAGNGPGLLVLDDPFSAVDVDTEARIVAALRDAFGPDAPPERRATIVLFSHRLAAFPRAERVVVLDEGRVVEEGSHTELSAAGGLYARIYRAQRAVERMAARAALAGAAT